MSRRKCLFCERPESALSARARRQAQHLYPLCGLHGNAWVQKWTGKMKGDYLEAVKRVRPPEETE